MPMTLFYLRRQLFRFVKCLLYVTVTLLSIISHTMQKSLNVLVIFPSTKLFLYKYLEGQLFVLAIRSTLNLLICFFIYYIKLGLPVS